MQQQSLLSLGVCLFAFGLAQFLHELLVPVVAWYDTCLLSHTLEGVLLSLHPWTGVPMEVCSDCCREGGSHSAHAPEQQPAADQLQQPSCSDRASGTGAPDMLLQHVYAVRPVRRVCAARLQSFTLELGHSPTPCQPESPTATHADWPIPTSCPLVAALAVATTNVCPCMQRSL